MEEILATCALLTNRYGLTADEICGLAVVWIKELVEHVPNQVDTAFQQIDCAFRIYRERGGSVFPSSAQIIAILKEMQPLSLPNPERERFEKIHKFGFKSIQDCDFYEKFATENGIRIFSDMREKIKDCRQRFEIAALPEAEKLARNQRMLQSIKDLKLKLSAGCA